MSNAYFKETQYGFIWGALTVTRCISVEKKTGHHIVLELSTPRQKLQIQITPTGLIRVHDIEKNNDYAIADRRPDEDVDF